MKLTILPLALMLAFSHPAHACCSDNSQIEWELDQMRQQQQQDRMERGYERMQRELDEMSRERSERKIFLDDDD